MRLVYTEISPGHIWTTLYIQTHAKMVEMYKCAQELFRNTDTSVE